MNYNDVIVRIIYLTKRNDFKHKELADIINRTKQSMNGRADRNSEFEEKELKAIEQHYNIDLSSVNISIDLNKNSKNTKSTKTLKEKLSGFPDRLKEIQKTTGLSDTDFAKKLELYRDEYLEYITGERRPDINIINNIKQNFDVSVDWLLYG